MRRRRRVAASTAALALGALLTTLAPAGAAEALGTAAHCTPAAHTLDRLTGTGWAGESVNGLGAGKLSVGESGGLPVYWTGRTVHPVPLPSGYVNGTVAAVNRHGLMVGTVRGSGGTSAFSYRRGASAVRLLPGGTYAADVDDRGRIAGGNATTGIGYVWSGTTRRTLTTTAGHHWIRVSGINNTGTVVGSAAYAPSDDVSGDVGLVWPGGTTGPATDLNPLVLDIETTWEVNAVDNHGRIVGERVTGHLDTSEETYWDAPYTADGVRVLPGLPGHEGKGSFNDISPTRGIVVGTAMFPHGIPPLTPIDQAQIWRPGHGPIRALPGLAPDGPAGAVSVNDRARVGGWAYDADPYEGSGVRHPVIWTCALG
jgi:hypothetical protein